MELRQYIRMVWKWWWLIFLSVMIAATTSYVASKVSTPVYSAKTTLMIGRVTENPEPNSADLWTGQQLAYTYAQLARREPVLQGAIDSLSLDLPWQSLREQVSSNIVAQTMLLEITVVDHDPYRAKVLADEIAKELIQQSPSSGQSTSAEELAFIESQMDDLKLKITAGHEEWMRLREELDAANSARQIQDLQNQIDIIEQKVGGWQETYAQLRTSLQGSGVNALSVVEQASLPFQPISPNVRMNVMLAAGIGLVLAVGGIFIIEYLDDTIKSSEDITRIVNLPTLGIISRIDGMDYPSKLVAVKEPLSPVVEAYRILRTNIQFTAVDKQVNMLLMTSAGPSEGKSVTLANLAVVMAQSGKRVIIIDTDLRRPVQHKIFGIPNRHGFSDVILDPEQGLKDYLQTTEVENLRILTSGSLPPNPAELLASKRMIELIELLKNDADIVMFDSPPALVVTDAVILSTRLDGVILITDVGRTRAPDTYQAVEELRRVDANLLGVVLNRLNVRRRDYGYYHYYYSDLGKVAQGKKRNGWLERRFPWLWKQDGTSRIVKKSQ